MATQWRVGGELARSSPAADHHEATAGARAAGREDLHRQVSPHTYRHTYTFTDSRARANTKSYTDAYRVHT